MLSSEHIFAPAPKEGELWDVAIIGSGPAGLTAAIYTTRGAASTLIIGGEKWGGQLMLTTEVDNFPTQPGIQGPKLMQAMREHALKFGAQMVEENLTMCKMAGKFFDLTTTGGNYKAKSVLIATGSDTRWLDVPGQEELRGRGVSSCAPCDAPFFKDKRVAVIGGGDAAMEEALVLTKFATSVTIIHRDTSFKASQAMQTKIFAKEKEGKVDIIWGSEVKEFVGTQKLEALKVFDTKTQEIKSVPFDGAFVAIGHVPATAMFKDVVELDSHGYVVKNERDGYHTATSRPGIFVAGDVHDWHYQQAITAAGFGCQAAMDTVRYLEHAHALTNSDQS